MKKFQRAKYFILGMVVMALFSVTITTAFASTTTRQISVMFRNIKIYVDGKLIQPKDAQGNAIEPFIYNGVTYLPLRAVAEALDKAVLWEGTTSSVYIGKHDSATPVILLHQMDFFDRKGYWVYRRTVQDNLGNTHNDGILHIDWGVCTTDYILDGRYRKMKGMFFLLYDYRTRQEACALRIYGDNKLLYSYNEMKAGVRPIEFDVDLTGVLQLRIEIENRNVAIANVGLYQ